MRTSQDSLPDLIRRVCADRPDRDSVVEFVALCRDLAEAYLRSHRVGFDPASREYNSGDLALDLIADLFRRDALGRFVELGEYFHPMPSDPGACFSAVRRLVFSQVSEGLFNRYRAHDPGLARLIRNLKSAVARAGYEIRERRGSRWIVFADVDWRLPGLPSEMIEARITGALRTGVSMDEMLLAVAHCVLAQSEYRAALPLVQVAQVLRSGWIHVNEGGDGSAPEGEPSDDLNGLVSHVVSGVRSALYETYVRSGKVPEDLFDAYQQVISEYLSDEYSGRGDGSTASLYQRFSDRMSGIARDEYATVHRARLEYMARFGRAMLVKSARDEFGLSADSGN